MAVRVREMTAEEVAAVRRLTRSRTASARAVERARIVWRSFQGQDVRAIAAELGVGPGTVRVWLKRFNARGLAGLRDAPRSGRPATYTPEDVGEVSAAALTKPPALGLPFGTWTLDRLAAYLNEHKGIPIKRSRIDELLLHERLRWRQQRTWFGVRGALQRARGVAPAEATPVDPGFARKTGRSRRSTPRPSSRRWPRSGDGTDRASGSPALPQTPRRVHAAGDGRSPVCPSSSTSAL
jgi:transposase